ncbi:6859_t:CDS:10 [Rhizophagus irregularis]|nr:6859_t:CDS:10 [Rhizophagus irregularis]
MSKSNGTKSPKMDMQENKQMFVRNKNMKTENVDFPRGGSASEYSVKNGKERNHQDDLLFNRQNNRSSDEEIEKPVKKKRKLKPSKLAKDSASNFDINDNKLKNEKSSVELLSIHHLNVGSYFLGRIVKINSMNLVVSLPCQMIGYVSINEISRPLSKIIANIADSEEDDEDEKENDENILPELSSLFKIGQWVRCKVSRIETPDDKKATSKHWRVHLTLVPDEVISASVESVEDHGYILSIGLDGIDGFLHNEDAKNYIKSYNNGNELTVGQVITVSVIKILDNKRTVKVTANPEIVAKTKISDAEVHNICSLLPGNLVTSVVSDICSNGIRVKIMGLLDGVIDLFHANPKIMTNLQEFHDNFKVGKKIHGRIIYVSFTTEAKRIRLSLLPHVVELKQHCSDIDNELSIDEAPVGKIIENVTVKKVDGRKGVLLEIENLNINGYVKFKSGSDPNHSNELTPGSTHRARVIGFAAFDNLLLLSTKKSVLEQKYFRFDDVNIGDVTQCKIVNIIESGILVSLSDNITALAPNIHLSDTSLTHPSQKFKLGTTHKCRVLNKDPSNNYIYVTFRPILINSDLPIFKSFNDVKVGIVTHGIIYGIIGQGCNVYFFCGMKAFVPINQCGIEGIKDTKHHFHIGQIVKCKITKIVNDKELIMGSFQINDMTNSDLSEINCGDMKKGKILQIKNDEIILSLIPSQIQQLRIDEVLSNLMVIAKNEQKGFVNVTKKPLLIEAKKNGKLPENLDEIEEGSFVCGYVRSVTDYAVFVGFLGGFSARATRERLADHYIASPVGIFHVNQSVIGLITRIDKETSRCEISLKPSVVSNNKYLPFINKGNFIKSYFEELLHTNKKSLNQEETKVMLGERVKCVLKKRLSSEQDEDDLDMVNDDHGGWKVVVIPNNENSHEKKIKGFISEEQANTNNDIKEGDQIEGIILDMDIKGKNVDLGIRPELFPSFEKNGKRKNKNSTGDGVSRKELKKLLNEKTSIDAIIEQVKEDYIIVSLPKYSNTIAFAASKTFNNRSPPFIKYQFGQTIKVQITHVPRHRKKSNNNSEDNSSNHHKHTLQYRVLVTILTDRDDKLIISGIKTIDDFSEGQVIKGTISGVENYGIFIKINNSVVSGLCHKSKISDDFVNELSDLFKIGDKVKAKILNIDKEKQNIDEDKSRSINLQWETDSDEQDSDNDESEENITQSQNEQNDDAPLSISSPWKWKESDDDDSNNNQTQEETPPSSSDHELENDQKKKHKKKKSKQPEIEDKTGDLMKQKPEVSADYERLLLGSPNSSYLWIQYMSHLLNLSEFDKAREIGERALKTINYKEEQEKMNIWIALMNLENNYGSDETMAGVLKRALQACNQKKIYMTLVEVYEKSNKFELAEQTYHTITKKFSQSSKVWYKMGLFYIQRGKIEAFRNLLQKSLKSLPKRKHIKTITKFARMEFKYGEAERGRTIFEGMMNNYPKRLDLWSIYIDMEIKAGVDDIVRRLFRRVVNLKFSTRQMRFLFKKWLKFEMEHGNDEQIEEVKEKAKTIAESMN